MEKVILKVNGRSRQFIVEPDRVLLDLLREDLGLTGTKQSCDRKGQCGACTVIVNGKAVRSCVQKVKNLANAEVITIEGLGTPENPHLIQEAYCLSGAIQCGFCTPGMIMATKALLDRNPNPDDGEIKKALEHNLCRCTGYARIIDAVKLAGRFIRGETTPAAIRPDPNGPKIGVSHPRPSAMIKACGMAEFGADIQLQDRPRGGRDTEHGASCPDQINRHVRGRKDARRCGGNDVERHQRDQQDQDHGGRPAYPCREQGAVSGRRHRHRGGQDEERGSGCSGHGESGVRAFTCP